MSKTDFINEGLLEAFHDELRKGMKRGTVEVNAANLTNWNERDNLAIQDSFADVVRTAAGDQSINSAAGAQIVSITPVTDFSATAFVTQGFNLLRQRVGII